MLHIMKVAVGVTDIEELQQINLRLANDNNGYPYTLTRFPPKQVEDILQGGSLYRVIKGSLCCRQLIKDFIPSKRDNGNPCIQILLEPEIIRTQSIAMRPFQGWRYLKPQDAPIDLSINGAQLLDIPIKLRKELEELALL
ncbi:DUF1489 domain [Commensalibacter communis]|uniref:DUF1489 family protein n=1 Tax=Commensalibacter communis TaxID=2972786 RepID=UPI0022FFAE7C|nr:DUF1489 domain-containing protein [Commensalibacter communis]CAI3959294.1 DUF1489 domain [Commensalibacter communis]CAI3960414.1 DUF1489 domain [Commensalibacter communis]